LSQIIAVITLSRESIPVTLLSLKGFLPDIAGASVCDKGAEEGIREARVDSVMLKVSQCSSQRRKSLGGLGVSWSSSCSNS
jgi:hypothetical protein